MIRALLTALLFASAATTPVAAQDNYRVEATVFEVAAGDGEADAGVGAIAYTVPDAGDRPILFAFNGGPGASSTFLHLGVLGPYRVDVPADPSVPLPTTAVPVSNAGGLLDTVDIVFLDPPGTGLSRRDQADPGVYNTVAGDARAVAQAVMQWLARHERQDAPIYILGESYGTIRAAAMLDAFAAMERAPDIRGVVLLGQALNMIETSQRPDNIISHVVSLPTMAAIACYHGRTAEPCAPREGATRAAEFARGPYLDALFAGSRLADDDRQEIADRLAALTGIGADYFIANDLNISKERFRVALLRDMGRVAGRYDARYTAPLPEDAGETIGPDAFSAVSNLYAAAMPGYLAQFAVVPDASAYKVLAPPEGGWSYGAADSPFADWPFMNSVERAAEGNRCLRLFVGTGLFDLTTTTGAADYLFARSDLPPGRYVSHTYDAGHMFYSDPASRTAVLDDLRRFVAEDPCA